MIFYSLFQKKKLINKSKSKIFKQDKPVFFISHLPAQKWALDSDNSAGFQGF